MRLPLSGFAALCLLLAAPPAHATKLMSKTFVCPIGGQKFTADVYGSYFGYGGRPDGRPIGTMRGYVPPPECPGNHLILYRDFSPAEIAALKPLIASPAYRGLLETDTVFYRIAWLEHALNPHAPDYVWDLLRATWYVDRDPEKKARYRAHFLAVAEGMPASPADMRSMMLRLRVLNVYRETGQFDRALKGLHALPIDDLAQGLPDTTSDDNDDVYKLSAADQARWSFVHAARVLERLIQRQDISPDPIDVLPNWRQWEECYFRQPKTAFETAFCATPDMRAQVDDQKDYFEAERATWDYDGPILAPPPPPKRKPAR